MQLKIEEIYKSYGEVKALKGVNMTLTEGVYGLLGPNGSGKTTLINIITDNLRADSGEVLFDGKNTLEMGVNFRSLVGYMPQYPGLYPAFSLYDFLEYIGVLKGLTAAQIREQSGEVLTAVGLYDVRKRKIKTLSGGMKQRLALAQAVMGNPKILILDEPTAGLDPSQRITIRNYISKISEGKIIILATHVVPDVEYIAKEVIFLREGAIIAQNPPDSLAETMKGKVWSVTVDSDDVALYTKKYRIANVRSDGAHTVLRVISDTAPVETAVALPPTLEDCYLYHFGESSIPTTV
ncbi:MAG: ATP-binding cassette domain-containing protein [Eubacteriales bacterium]|nr:ATP-binding cassette domain-containing protein [Eubacteriales bacterium]